MGTQQLGDEHGDIFVEVQPDKECGLGHWRRGCSFSAGTRFRRMSSSIVSRCS
jgi:hypothetical protein